MMIWSFSRIIKNYASLLPPRDWSFCARQQRTCLLQHQTKHQTMKHFKLSQTCTHCARQKVQMIEMNKYRDHILFKLNNNKKVKSTTTAAKNTCHIQLYSKSIRQTTLNIIWSVSSYQNQMRETLSKHNDLLKLCPGLIISSCPVFLFRVPVGEKKLETLLKAEKQPLKQHWSITGTDHQSDMSQ